MPYSQMRNPFSSPLEKRTKEERKSLELSVKSLGKSVELKEKTKKK